MKVKMITTQYGNIIPNMLKRNSLSFQRVSLLPRTINTWWDQHQISEPETIKFRVKYLLDKKEIH